MRNDFLAPPAQARATGGMSPHTLLATRKQGFPLRPRAICRGQPQEAALWPVKSVCQDQDRTGGDETTGANSDVT